MVLDEKEKESSKDTKRFLRQDMLTLRMSYLKSVSLSDLIADFRSLIREKNLLQGENSVAVYCPIQAEVDILAIMEDYKGSLALPVIDPLTKEMQFRSWKEGDPLIKNMYGILEPSKEAKLVEPDVVFVPLLAFDESGHRLGYGGGYYDKYLQRLKSEAKNRKTIFIGLAYESQKLDVIPIEDHDEKLDFILTEKKLYSGNI